MQYKDLVLQTVKKSAWVLPVDAETNETGTLADLLVSLGIDVVEVDLDAEHHKELRGGLLL